MFLQETFCIESVLAVKHGNPDASENPIVKARAAACSIRRSADMTRELRDLTSVRRGGVSVELDLPIRWDSTANMIKRICEIKAEVNSVLAMHDKPQLTSRDFEVLEIVLQSLQHASMAYSYFSRRDLNLAAADRTNYVFLKKLQDDKTEFAKRFSVNLKSQIMKRRTLITPLMNVLEGDRKFMMEKLLHLPEPPTSALAKECLRLLAVDRQEATASDEEDTQLVEERDEWEAVLNPPVAKPQKQSASTLKARVLQEVKDVMKGAARGPELDRVYETLQCIPVSSVESERMFSTMNIVHTKIRSSMKPATLSKILFLRNILR